MADGTIWRCPSVRDGAPAAHSGARGKPPCRQTSLADLEWPACLVTDAVRRAGSPWAHSRARSIAGGGTVPGRHSFRFSCGQASEQRPGRAGLSPGGDSRVLPSASRGLVSVTPLPAPWGFLSCRACAAPPARWCLVIRVPVKPPS